MNVNFLRVERLAALGANHDWVKMFVAVFVLVQPRTPPGIDHVQIAPMNDGHHNRIKIETLLSENILVSLRRLLIRNAAQNTKSDELFQPFRQKMPCYAERR